jgi:Rrf2 family protein
MEITHQADYALRAILYLARLEPSKRVPTSQIAAANKIPSSFLTKIISQLSIAGLIHTSRGARGGVWLAHPPEKITLLDVIVAIDGPIRLNQCVEDPGGCAISKTCILNGFWKDTCGILVGRLQSTNFEQLVNRNDASVAA